MTETKRARQHELEQLCHALASIETADEARALLDDILSKNEVAAAGQRLEVARLLSEGRSYVDVSSLTGASSTTVSRVSKCLNKGAGGYQIVLKRITS